MTSSVKKWRLCLTRRLIPAIIRHCLMRPNIRAAFITTDSKPAIGLALARCCWSSDFFKRLIQLGKSTEEQLSMDLILKKQDHILITSLSKRTLYSLQVEFIPNMKLGSARVFHYMVLLLACNYFAFRVELFRDEFEFNHHQPLPGNSVSGLTLNWETFDKDNAPKAFVFNPEIRIECTGPCLDQRKPPLRIHQKRQPIRDKSPPANLS